MDDFGNPKGPAFARRTQLSVRGVPNDRERLLEVQGAARRLDRSLGGLMETNKIDKGQR